MFESIAPDIKFAARQLRQNPAFTCAAVFALALGIGANTAIFSAVNAVLLNSQPFRTIKDPARLMLLYERNPAILAFISERLPVRLQNYRAWKKQSQSFEGLAAYESTTLDLASSNGGGPRNVERVDAAAVSADFFPLLGVNPRLGRGFSTAEAQPGNDRVALLTDDFWRSRFLADPGVIGKTLRASGALYQIVGVLPASFSLPATGQGLDQNKPKIWTPLAVDAKPQDGVNNNLIVFGRLRPGVSLSHARAEMHEIGNRLARADDAFNRGWGVNVFPAVSEDVDPSVRRALFILQAAVGFVLLIACGNVANLLLTKAVAREKEMAIRLALGAGKGRILRQTLSESLLLSCLGGVAGLLVSFGALRILSHLAPKDIHGFHELRIDPPVFFFALAISLLTGLLFGLAPSFYALRQDVQQALNRGGRSLSGSSSSLRSALAVAEIALSLMLLIGAGLTIRSLSSLMRLDLGFRSDHLLTMRIALPASHYSKPETVANFNDQLLARVQHLPGVRAVSLSTALPMRTINEQSYQLPGIPEDRNKPLVTDWARVTAGHVKAVGMRILRGRDFEPADMLALQPHVALVNEAFAKANWPNQQPLAKQFLFANEQGKEIPYSVVGVVSDEHQFGPDTATHTQIYLPGHHQQSSSLVVRSSGDPLALTNAVKQQVWAIDQDQPVSAVASMDNILYEWTAPRRFTMTVLLNFAGIALLLAAVGLYSVLAYSVSLRTREIGIRMALGAAPAQVVTFVLRQGVVLALLGIGLGLAGAFALTQLMQSILFGISASDPITFIAVSVLLLAVALAASFLPARRALRIEPQLALRAE